VRRYGGHPDGEAMVVSGTYQLEGDVSRRLLAALPSILVVLILAEVRGKRQLIKGPLR
jgi:Cupin